MRIIVDPTQPGDLTESSKPQIHLQLVDAVLGVGAAVGPGHSSGAPCCIDALDPAEALCSLQRSRKTLLAA